MSNVQAAIGVAQLERIDQILAKKRQVGRWYQRRLQGHPRLQLPIERTDYAENIYWVFGVVLDDALPFDAVEIIARLKNKGVDSRHFFWPIHNSQYFARKAGLLPIVARMQSASRGGDFICRVV